MYKKIVICFLLNIFLVDSCAEIKELLLAELRAYYLVQQETIDNLSKKGTELFGASDFESYKDDVLRSIDALSEEQVISMLRAAQILLLGRKKRVELHVRRSNRESMPYSLHESILPATFTMVLKLKLNS
jgi:hypothetical protein